MLGVVITFGFLLLGLFVMVVILNDDIDISDKFFLCFIFVGVSFVTIHTSDIYGYKNGQVDAINGEINYELQAQEDNTVKWVEIKKD